MLKSYHLSGKLLIYLMLPVLLLILPGLARAGGDSLHLVNNLRLGVKYQHGWIYPHHNSIRYATEEVLRGAEIHLTTDSYGRNEWENYYRYPRYGIAYLYTSLGNDAVHGKAHAMFMSLDIPLTSFEKRLRASYQFCLGISYINKIFDPTENPLNHAISTHFNVYASFRMNIAYRLSKSTEAYSGLCLSHYSNGRISAPNYGLNTVALQIGFRTNLMEPRYPQRVAGTVPFHRVHQLSLVLSGGVKTDDQLSGKHYPVSTLVGDYSYQFSRKYGALAGFDLFYDGSLGPNLQATLDREYQGNDFCQMGLHAGVTARFAAIQLYGNIGRYIYATFTKYSRTYLRLGIRYSLGPSWMVNLSIKSHYAIADYIEWGIGYRIGLNRKKER